MSKRNDAKLFSKLDLLDTYVYDISGRRRFYPSKSQLLHTKLPTSFNRFPFGIRILLSIFQEVRDTMLAEYDFAIPSLDDKVI